MDALVIGPPRGLPSAIARGLRRRDLSVLQAIPTDAADSERATWLLDEAGRPPLIVVFDCAPFALVNQLLALTQAEIVLVAEQRAPAVRPTAVSVRANIPRDADGLTVVSLGRAGRRWFQLGPGRHEPMGPERAAALVLRSCGAEAVSYR